MKKLILVLLTLAAGLNLNAQNNPRNLGLMSQIIYVKNISENYMVALLTDSSQSKESKENTILNYNEVKMQYDQVILTLEQDMFLANSYREFKKLDKALRNSKTDTIDPRSLKDKKLQLYAMRLNKAYRTFQTSIYQKCFLDPKHPQAAGMGTTALCGSYFMKLIPCTAGEIVAVGTIISAAIKNANDMKEKKVNKIAMMLDQLRLKSTAELSADINKKSNKLKKNKGKVQASDAEGDE
jgi:hypothetical protein